MKFWLCFWILLVCFEIIGLYLLFIMVVILVNCWSSLVCFCINWLVCCGLILCKCLCSSFGLMFYNFFSLLSFCLSFGLNLVFLLVLCSICIIFWFSWLMIMFVWFLFFFFSGLLRVFFRCLVLVNLFINCLRVIFGFLINGFMVLIVCKVV